MAIIYSYPENTNILGTDMLVGTSTVVRNGRPKNQTKSFSVASLKTFINTSELSGTGTINYLPKFTGTTTIGNSTIIDSSGRILIGTTVDNGVDKLQINGSADFAGQVKLRAGAFIQADTNLFFEAADNGPGFPIYSTSNVYGNDVLNIANFLYLSEDGGQAFFGCSVTATQLKVSSLNVAPASATALGDIGEIRITSGFIYVCIATNTWVRTALTTW